MQLCRASSSMPLVTPMVEIDGVPYLDGGIADSIPLIHSMRSGYRKNVLILTRNKGYRKTISKRDVLMYQTVLRIIRIWQGHFAAGHVSTMKSWNWWNAGRKKEGFL